MKLGLGTAGGYITMLPGFEKAVIFPLATCISGYDYTNTWPEIIGPNDTDELPGRMGAGL